MLFLVAMFVAISVGFLVLFIIQVAPGRSRAVARGLAELQDFDRVGSEVALRRRRQHRAEHFKEILEGLGERVSAGRRDASAFQQMLVQGGFLGAQALPIFWGARLLSLIGTICLGLLLGPFVTQTALGPIFLALWAGAFGWVAPVFWLRRRVRVRQKAVQKALPDALDMMVVCVEAGLGLNQALVRVAQEIAHVSHLMSEQLTLVNLEIRAGTAREEALKNLGDRTGLEDVRSLATMLIQTDRFGTSIAQALRVHADTMRTKRRQRAEEAAAKTTIKLVFPLVFFIFPAMFAVILAPALIQIMRTLGSM